MTPEYEMMLRQKPGFRAAAVVGVLLSQCATAHAATNAAFSLQQVLSAPFPSGLIAAPAAGRVAWIYNDRGARNLWVAEKDATGAMRGRAVTRYSGDDGVDMGELSWAPDGTTIVFSRGGSLEGGAPVNPLSLVSGPPEQAVFAASIDGGTPRRIGPGHSAQVSPHGDAVSYIRDGQIWSAPLSGGAPVQIIHDRGDDTGLIWSSDGARLAFVSTRAGRSIVGVLDLAAKQIAWMAPSVDSDMAPEWSPDGKRLAFIRIPAGEGAVDFKPHPEGAPWSIWVCDAMTGKGHAVWTAQSGRGSVFHGTITDRVLMWAQGDRLIFPWERTGWLHLYTVPAAGGEAAELTTGGKFEVFNTALNPARDTVVYSGNADDIDRWHLWSAQLGPASSGTVSQGSNAPRELTGGAGIEDYPVVTSDNTVVAVHSDAQTPVRPVMIGGNGSLLDVAPGAVPTDFPAASLVTPETVTFSAADGLTVHGQLFVPPHRQPGRGPAILFFHGGPIRQMLPAWHPMDAYSFMYGFNQYLASEGYVVLSVNYRGGIGYGLDFREAKDFGADGASELNDILGAASYLRGRADIDPQSIGIWGGSYGGLMTALGLARAPDILAAGVDYAGVHDWRAMLPQLSGPEAQRAFDASALATIDKWRAPVLVAHNDDDREVPFAQSIELVQALRQHNLPFEQLVIPDEGHVMLRATSWLRFFEASDQFLRRHLAGRP
jgi:dipeptidyl aminopeptidase/acylaminoacyl peptidase